MAVKTREELMAKLKEIVKENDSDDVLEYMEDVSDTFDDYETRLGSPDAWKRKYEENDKAWRARYKERFLTGRPVPGGEEPDDKSEEVAEKIGFDELFKEVK